MPEVGFILLTHRNPPQAARLVKTLNRLFNYPPIVCHHDFSKCDFAPGLFSENVTFVRPFFTTGWAKFSVVRATVRALEIIFSMSPPPKWAVVLSGADYSIKNADTILEDLNRGGYDAPQTRAGWWIKETEKTIRPSKNIFGDIAAVSSPFIRLIGVSAIESGKGGFGYLSIPRPNCPFQRRFNAMQVSNGFP